MPRTTINGVSLNYEVLGASGAWVTLSPGGRRGLDGVAGIATKIAGAGYRVLIHDRRNCGSSDASVDGEGSEYEIWAEDLFALLNQLGATPVYAGGSSSGCRLMLTLALKHPEAVRALLLWRVTGGPFAAKRLAHEYYGQFIEAAQQGGMEAVCKTEFFSERIQANPSNRQRLLDIPVSEFLEGMGRWRQYFVEAADLPVIGATEERLRGLTMPAIVIPGNDRTHGLETGQNLSRLLPNARLHVLMPEFEDVDVADWNDKDDAIASIFTSFLSEVRPRSGAAAGR